MTKKRFLKLLEEKLKILDDTERQDIINEYNDTIDEKVKHGQTEKEAVADFDDIDALAKEILKAYKINPSYEEKAASQTKKIMDDCEGFIKESASKLATGTKKIAHDFKKANGDFNIDLIFEIIIKSIFVLLGLVILRIPFEIIQNIGEGIFDILLHPFDNILIFIWQLVISILYFITCILVIIIIFKKYFDGGEYKEVKHQKKSKTKNNQEEKIEEEIIAEEVSSKEVVRSDNNPITILLKIFFVICFLFPIWCINLSLVAVIVVLIYLLFKGVAVMGVLLIIIGLSILFGYIADVLSSLIFSHKKIYFFPFMLSAVLIMAGGIVFGETSLQYTYDENITNSNLRMETTYNDTINGETVIKTTRGTREIIIDETLANNQLRVEVEYFINYKVDKNNNKITFEPNYTANNKKLFDLFIEDLKDKKVYNYEDIYTCNINIYVNSATVNLIK